MSDNTNLTNEVPTKESFINTVFSFDEESRAEYLNIAQYTVLAIIPILLLNKLVGYAMPIVDETKGSVEITIEVVIQSLILFIGILVINKAVRYLPTYSGVDYQPMDIISIIPIFLVIMLSLQTRIGQKSAIVVDRTIEMISERTGIDMKNATQKESETNNKQVKKTAHPNVPHLAPQTRNTMPAPPSVPSVPSMTSMQSAPNHAPTLSSSAAGPYSGPDFNTMYSGPNISYSNANTPSSGSGLSGDLLGDHSINEPMAANSVLGGGFGTAI